MKQVHVNMPPASKLFTLDPINTTLTAPTTDFQVQGPADRSVAKQQLNRGLAVFANAVGNAGELAKQRRIKADTDLAENAAIRGDSRPEGLLGVASRAFDRVVDANAANKKLEEIDAYAQGADGFNDVNSEGPLSAKLAQVQQKYDRFLAEGLREGGDPTVSQQFTLGVNKRLQAVKKEINAVDLQRSQRVIIERVRTQVDELVTVSKDSETPLEDMRVPQMITGFAKEIESFDVQIGAGEAKLLVFQMIAQNEDMLLEPEFVHSLLKTPFAKDITFNTLLAKSDKEGTAFAQIYKTYVAASKAAFKLADDNQTAANAENKKAITDGIMDDTIRRGETSAEGVAQSLVSSGHFKLPAALLYEENLQKYMDRNIKAQRGSVEHLKVLELIQHQIITKDTALDSMSIAAGLNPDLVPNLKSYMTEEGKQKLAFIKSYQDQIKDLSKNVLSLSKLALGSKAKKILAGTSTGTVEETRDALLGMGLEPIKVNRIVKQVQDLHNGMNKLAEKMGVADSIADKADGSVSDERLTQFQNVMEKQIDLLVKEIDSKLGIQPRPDTPIKMGETGQLEFPVISTSSEYPLVVNQSSDIFGTLKEDGTGAANIGGGSGASTFTTPDVSFSQYGNFTLKALVLDAVTKHSPEALAEMAIKAAEQQQQQKEQARLTDTSRPLADRNVEAGNSIFRVGDFQLTVDSFNAAADFVENNVFNRLVDFVQKAQIFDDGIQMPDRVTPKILAEQEPQRTNDELAKALGFGEETDIPDKQIPNERTPNEEDTSISSTVPDAVPGSTEPVPVADASKKEAQPVIESLLDSIYIAEGKDKASVPFGMFTEDFKTRRDNGEQIPVAEAREETAKHLNRHIKLWETNSSRNVDQAEERGLVNANPEQTEAIQEGKFTPEFLEWYGEIYAPSSSVNNNLSAAEKTKNVNWLKNVTSNIKSKVTPVPSIEESPNLKVSALEKMFGTSEAEASKIQMMGNTTGKPKEISPTVYKIKQGDSLSKIAKANNMTVQELQKLNNIKDVNKIRAGQVINVGKFSMNPKSPQVPDDVPKIFEENIIPIYGSHANAALNHIRASRYEAAGEPVPDYLKKTITEKSFAPDVLNSVRVAAYKALINNRPTSYKDYGDAWKLVYGGERSKLSYTQQVLKTLSSFFDPGMAAAFTIGESGGVVVRNGNLMIVGDEFNFPEIKEKTKDGSFWLEFNSWFADKDASKEGKGGMFSVTPKNRQKIEINLGPIADVKRYANSLKNKKVKKGKL